MEQLAEDFTLHGLDDSVIVVRGRHNPVPRSLRNTLDCIRWLADSNYEVQFPASVAVSERIIFPVSGNESNGIEDARFVRFTDDDGTVIYSATYTAYNGRTVLPQLI